jgi:hypothetical protein
MKDKIFIWLFFSYLYMGRISHEDPIKDKWRDALYHFIRKQKHFLRGNPRDWKVAFFPGEKALELRVYDQLKIPRENLIGLERDPKLHKKLKKKNLGFKLTSQPMDALDFFKETNEKFDIINLDYKGNLNDNIVETLENISGRQLLSEESIFGITCYAKREQKNVKEVYKSAFNQELEAKIFIDSLYYKDFNKTDIDQYIKNKSYSSFQKFKDQAITELVREIFVGGRDNLFINPIIKRTPHYNELINKSKNVLEENNLEYKSEFELVRGFLRAHAFHLLNHFVDTGFIDSIQDPIGSVYAELATAFYTSPYYVKKLQKYKYTSTNRALMFSDLFGFSQQRKFFDKNKYLAEHIYRDLNFNDFASSFFKKPSSKKTSNKVSNKIVKSLNILNKINIDSHKTSKRIDLGSSAKLPKLTGVDYYGRRYADSQNGISKKQTWDSLITEYKVSRSQLPRFEAYYSMETHGPKFLSDIDDSFQELENETLEKKIAFNEFDIIPFGFWKRLSVDQQERIRYFVTDDMIKFNMSDEETKNLLDDILESKWYKIQNGNEISNLQFYAFFDDLLLEYMNKESISQNRIKNLFENVIKPSWKKNYPRKILPILTLNEYINLVESGKNDDWISQNYRTKKPKSIKAYKAWITKKSRIQLNKGEIGPEMIRMRREGKTKEEVMEILNLEEYQYRGYLAAFKRGAYGSILNKDTNTTISIVDSHGVVHFKSNKNIRDIERGYE